jgi:hypothetical protein
MALRKPRYSPEEFARRGDEIYETRVRPRAEADHYGKIVAIAPIKLLRSSRIKHR